MHRFHHIDQARNMHRFYEIGIEKDLFGCVILCRNWGRIGTSGRLLHEICSNVGEANERLARLIDEKRKRGYDRVGGFGVETG